MVNEVRFSRISNGDSGYVGLCSVRLTSGVVIYGVKVKALSRGRYKVIMPERRVGIDNAIKSVVVLDDKTLRDEVFTAVIEKYKALVS